MKTIVKFFSINDGQQKQLVNRDFLFMQEFPRVEAILSEFLSEGYTLQSCLQKVTPGTNQPGAYNFYLGGWDIILTKQMEEDEEDRSDELMQRAIAKAASQGSGSRKYDDENGN